MFYMSFKLYKELRNILRTPTLGGRFIWTALQKRWDGSQSFYCSKIQSKSILDIFWKTLTLNIWNVSNNICSIILLSANFESEEVIHMDTMMWFLPSTVPRSEVTAFSTTCKNRWLQYQIVKTRILLSHLHYSVSCISMCMKRDSR